MTAEPTLTAPLSPPARKRRLTPAFTPFLPLAIATVLILILPFLAPHDPNATTSETLAPPGGSHWFGTDGTGADVLSRVLYAGRLDLVIAAAGVGIAFLIAAPLGAVIGYSSGMIGSVGMRAMDFVQSFPPFIFAMALVAATGQSVRNIIAVIALLNVPIFVRLIRSEILGLRSRTFVDAARAVGNSPFRLVMRHVLPNSIGTALAQASSSIGWALLLTAGLSFVGAGVRPPTPEWGGMISEGAKNIITGEWWIAVFPGLALGLLVLAFAIASDGTRRLMNVRANGRG